MTLEQIAIEDIDKMSLHEISQRFGTEGLLIRYNSEVARLPDEAQQQINQALLSAVEWHKDQRRTNGPYIDHVLRVQIRIISHYGIEDPDILIAALLHDSIEDQSDKIVGRDNATAEEALAVLSKRFNPRVERILSALTNPPGEISREEYDDHVRKALLAEPDAIPVKISDFTDNGVGIFWTKGEDKKYKLALKYLPLVEFYQDVVISDVYPFKDNVKVKILEQLNDAKRRMRDIIKVAQSRSTSDISLSHL